MYLSYVVDFSSEDVDVGSRVFACGLRPFMQSIISTLAISTYKACTLILSAQCLVMLEVGFQVKEGTQCWHQAISYEKIQSISIIVAAGSRGLEAKKMEKSCRAPKIFPKLNTLVQCLLIQFSPFGLESLSFVKDQFQNRINQVYLQCEFSEQNPTSYD